MRIARYRHKGEIYFGVLDGEELFAPYGTLWQQLARGSFAARLDEVELLAPIIPGKIVCVGRNYREHAQEFGNEIPTEPLLFLKPPSSVIGPGDAIIYPAVTENLHYEGELALIIGRTARRVAERDALSYVYGYTCANDVTARDLQKKDGQWTRAKGCDTFCPLGPWIVTDLDPGRLRVRTLLNDEPRQDSTTDLLIFSLPTLLSYITSMMTLEPGDLVLTGTPAGVGPMQPGDTVEVAIEGIGSLRNTVVRGY
jgi:2-keto-4-pentenoate hydratase/2-oxohepta-3-ene-1,7-dioic acid hydratase in catechol pathway